MAKGKKKGARAVKVEPAKLPGQLKTARVGKHPDGKPKYVTSLIATRDVKAGELVFEEETRFVGPNSFLAKEGRLCLGCSKYVKTSYVCSVCAWPVCSAECEKLVCHSEYECKVFAKNKIFPPREFNELEGSTVGALRLLLKGKQMSTEWDKLLKLDDLVESIDDTIQYFHFASAVAQFIRETCHFNVDIAVLNKLSTLFFLDPAVGQDAAEGEIDGAYFGIFTAVNYAKAKELNVTGNTHVRFEGEEPGKLKVRVFATEAIQQGKNIVIGEGVVLNAAPMILNVKDRCTTRTQQ